jgi:hypothetical protein
MLAYRTTKCPYCGANIDTFKPYGVNDYSNNLGEPYGYCNSCGGQYKTGKQTWHQMDFDKKFIIIIKLIFNIIASSFIISFFGLMFIYILKELIFTNSFGWLLKYENESGKLITNVALIISPIIAILGIISLRYEIRKY